MLYFTFIFLEDISHAYFQLIFYGLLIFFAWYNLFGVVFLLDHCVPHMSNHFSLRAYAFLRVSVLIEHNVKHVCGG